MRFLDTACFWLSEHPRSVGYAAGIICILFVGAFEGRPM